MKWKSTLHNGSIDNFSKIFETFQIFFDENFSKKLKQFKLVTQVIIEVLKNNLAKKDS